MSKVTDEELVDSIMLAVKVLNQRLVLAGERDMYVNIEMVVLNGKTFPSFRIESVYKRIDKPLILRA